MKKYLAILTLLLTGCMSDQEYTNTMMSNYRNTCVNAMGIDPYNDKEMLKCMKYLDSQDREDDREFFNEGRRDRHDRNREHNRYNSNNPRPNCMDVTMGGSKVKKCKYQNGHSEICYRNNSKEICTSERDYMNSRKNNYR